MKAVLIACGLWVHNLQTNSEVDKPALIIFFLLIYFFSWSSRDGITWCAQYDTSTTGCQRTALSAVEPSRSNTTQAFLLGEYFSDPRPDVLLVFSNTHDEMTLSQHSANVDQFARLVDQLVSPSTRLVWASRHAEDDTKKPASWRYRRYIQNDGRRLTRLQWLDEANRILYAKMRQRFIDGRRPTLMFPDLLVMSQLALKELNKDGVHMYDAWYQSVVSFIVQSLCHQSSSALWYRLITSVVPNFQVVLGLLLNSKILADSSSCFSCEWLSLCRSTVCA